MLFITRHTAIVGIVMSTLIAGACSTPAPAGGEGNPDRSPASASRAASTPGTPAEPSTGYEGFLEKMSCDMLRGWAWDRSQPDRPLSIELYDGERLLKTVVADEFRQDLLDARKGNGRHLFIESPPAELKDGKPHSIRAVVVGTSYTLRALPDTPSSITCPK